MWLKFHCFHIITDTEVSYHDICTLVININVWPKVLWIKLKGYASVPWHIIDHPFLYKSFYKITYLLVLLECVMYECVHAETSNQSCIEIFSNKHFQFTIVAIMYGSWEMYGRRLVTIWLDKLPLEVRAARSWTVEGRIIDIGAISWRFSWLNLSESSYLIT